MRVPDGVEDLAHRDGRRGVLADHLKPSCNSAGRRIFHPEQMERLQFLAQAAGFDGRQPMVAVMQQMQFIAKLLATRANSFGTWRR